MQSKDIGAIIGNGIGYVFAAIQTNEVLQIIQFVISSLLTIVILLYKVWKWLREAKKDGKITNEEIDELGDILDEAKKDIDKKEDDSK